MPIRAERLSRIPTRTAIMLPQRPAGAPPPRPAGNPPGSPPPKSPVGKPPGPPAGPPPGTPVSSKLSYCNNTSLRQCGVDMRHGSTAPWPRRTQENWRSAFLSAKTKICTTAVLDICIVPGTVQGTVQNMARENENITKRYE